MGTAIRKLLLVVALIVATSATMGAQLIVRRPVVASSPAINPIDAARIPPANTWETAGATIVNRSTICVTAACNTMTAAGTAATVAQINAAIASASANTVVKLAAGTYNFTGAASGGFALRNDNVTLRGTGSTGVANGGTRVILDDSTDNYSTIEIKPSGDTDAGTIQNSGTWTASSYAKGATQITLTRTVGGTAPVVGAVIVLDQANDTDTDTGNIWVNSNGTSVPTSTPDICCDEGGGANSRTVSATKYGTQQIVKVTAVSGSNPYTVTFTPGLAMPNWSASKNPGAWWPNNTAVTGVGLEDLELDGSGLTGTGHGNIQFQNATNCWVARVKSRLGARWHIRFQQSNYITVRDSYLDEDQDHGSQAYGFEWYDASNILVENNILHHVTLPIAFNETGTGSVVAYNYVIDNTYTASANHMIGGFGLHEVGVEMILFEGNDGQGGFISDAIHGTHHFITVFRNRFLGRESVGQTVWTNPIHVYSYGRYYNMVGNVLGENGYHTNYQNNDDLSIYVLGVNGCSTGCTADSLVSSTLFRWANYDVVTAASVFNNAEVPSGISPYPNAIPASHAIPSSLYLSTKPSFYGSKTWPSIGPDITGGDITGVNGTAYKNPARLCYEAGPLDPTTHEMTNFDPTRCYP